MEVCLLLLFSIDNVYSSLLGSKSDSQRILSPCTKQCLPETDYKESIMKTGRAWDWDFRSRNRSTQNEMTRSYFNKGFSQEFLRKICIVLEDKTKPAVFHGKKISCRFSCDSCFPNAGWMLFQDSKSPNASNILPVSRVSFPVSKWISSYTSTAC